MLYRAFLISGLALVATSNFAKQADSAVLPTHNTLTLEEQRDTYKKAKKALRQGHTKRFEKLKNQLSDYALYSYLEYYELRRTAINLNGDDIERFRSQYPNSPLPNRLNNHWMNVLSSHKKWDTFLANYSPSSDAKNVTKNNAKLDCLYYRALLRSGDTEGAYAGAQKLWVVGHSQHDACNPLFSQWQKSADFTPQIAWQRTEKAMQKGNKKLAKYIERYLSPELKKLSQEWRRVYNTPQRLTTLSRYQPYLDNPETRLATHAIIESGLKRLVHRDYKMAHRLLPRYEQHVTFSDERRITLYDYYARNMAVNYLPEAETWLNLRLAEPNSSHIGPYGIRHALRAEDWPRVKRWIALLEPSVQQQKGWQYWKARADRELQKQRSPLLTTSSTDKKSVFNQPTVVMKTHEDIMEGLHDHQRFERLLPESSKALLITDATPAQTLRALATERNYYSFIASRDLKASLKLNHESYQPTQEEYQQVLNIIGIKRARELFMVEEPEQADREWYYAIRNMPKHQRSIAAQIAAEWEWHYEAIIAAAGAENRDDLEIRFPRPHYSAITKSTQKYGVQPDWVYSLIRQESAFLDNARSPVGAMGLMQLMPSTAKEVARSTRIRLRSTKQLLNAHKNIQLGTAYLSQLLKQFDGNLVVASAAYNAGPHRAERWRPKDTSMPGDIWVETIPIKETRNYVKNIVTYQPIYQAHLGMTPTLTHALGAITPRT